MGCGTVGTLTLFQGWAERMMLETDETYLGDGAYASFDGYQIRLRAGDQIVYLEPRVYRALVDYVSALKAQVDAR